MIVHMIIKIIRLMNSFIRLGGIYKWMRKKG